LLQSAITFTLDFSRDQLPCLKAQRIHSATILRRRNSPRRHATEATASNEGDATGGVIPYKNMPALLAYYLGLFSLFPCIGLFLAIPAFVLGIMGLQNANRTRR